MQVCNWLHRQLPTVAFCLYLSLPCFITASFPKARVHLLCLKMLPCTHGAAPSARHTACRRREPVAKGLQTCRHACMISPHTDSLTQMTRKQKLRGGETSLSQGTTGTDLGCGTHSKQGQRAEDARSQSSAAAHIIARKEHFGKRNTKQTGMSEQELSALRCPRLCAPSLCGMHSALKFIFQASELRQEHCN